MVRLLSIALVAIGLMSLLAVAFGAGSSGDNAASAEAAAEATSAPSSHEAQALLLKRDGSGQFHLTATANGSDVTFLIDTGADMVALTAAEAENLGLMLNDNDFQPMAQTASGVGYGAEVTLDELLVAGQEFHDVEAVVMRGLSTNLLGQTVLSRFGKVELKGDSMVIHRR